MLQRPFSALAGVVNMADGRANAYILGRIRAMNKHSEGEIADIATNMHSLRAKFLATQQSWHIKPIFLGFHGFASDFERSVFLRCVKFCIKPRVIHSAFMPNGGFEGVLVVHPSTEGAGMHDLEALFELFKMSAGLTDLGSYMSAPMIACIERVETGIRYYGNWRCLRSSCVRNAYLHAKQKRDIEVQYERVRYETGLPFSTTNMLAIHYQLNNTQIELMQSSDLLARLRRLLDTLPPTFNVYGSDAIHEPSPLHAQYVHNMQQLIDDLLHTLHPAAPPGIHTVYVDLS